MKKGIVLSIVLFTISSVYAQIITFEEREAEREAAERQAAERTAAQRNFVQANSQNNLGRGQMTRLEGRRLTEAVNKVRSDTGQITSRLYNQAGDMQRVDRELRGIARQIRDFDFSEGKIEDFQRLQNRVDAIRTQSQEYATQLRNELAGLASAMSTTGELLHPYVSEREDDYRSLPDETARALRRLEVLEYELRGHIEKVEEFRNQDNDKLGLMADVAHNRGVLQKFINHDLPNLTQRILRTSCSQASECTNNNDALNDLPQGSQVKSLTKYERKVKEQGRPRQTEVDSIHTIPSNEPSDYFIGSTSAYVDPCFRCCLGRHRNAFFVCQGPDILTSFGKNTAS